MKKLLTMAPMVALMLAGSAPALKAQQTDEVLALNYNLTFVLQGPTVTGRTTVASSVRVVHVNTTNIIQALGAATGNTFSSASQLQLLTPTNDLDYFLWSVQVVDGNNTVDVTGFFGHFPGDSVGSSTMNTRNGNINSTDYSLDQFTINDQGGFPSLSLHFNGTGFTTTSTRGVVVHGAVVGQVDRLTADLTGTGDYQGNFAVIRGTLTGIGVGTVTVAPVVVAN